MAEFLIFTMVILCIVFLIFLIQIPIFIARGRGISGTELASITVLSWCGIFLGVTWLVALILALIWQPSGVTGGAQSPSDIAEQLSKLHRLKQKGAITQKEFDATKKKLLG